MAPLLLSSAVCLLCSLQTKLLQGTRDRHANYLAAMFVRKISRWHWVKSSTILSKIATLMQSYSLME